MHSISAGVFLVLYSLPIQKIHYHGHQNLSSFLVHNVCPVGFIVRDVRGMIKDYVDFSNSF